MSAEPRSLTDAIHRLLEDNRAILDDTGVTEPGTETRTWSLPPEPGPEVKAVRDRLNAEWERCGRRWRPVGSLGPERFWAEVLAFYGPLTDATQEAPHAR